MQRNMEYLWFGNWGQPLVIFPTSMGRFYDNEERGVVGSLAAKVDAGELQVVCVDSVDAESWYNHSAHPADRARRHEQYDSYLRHELFPYVQNRSGRERIIVQGSSFGAYHAANVAGRHPELVSKAVLFSGVYAIQRFLDGYWDDRCYFHCPTAYIANMNADWCARLSRVSWVIATGEHDSLVEDNRSFASLLASKGIPHHAEFWPGVFGHDWPWWIDNLGRFVP